MVVQVLAADPASSELLAELLLPHLKAFLVEDEQALPPIILHKCAQLNQVRSSPCMIPRTVSV